MSVYIAGASGFVGRTVLRRLKESGYRVVGITRVRYPENIMEFVSWDSVQADGFSDDVEAVVNLSGLSMFNYRQRWSSKLRKEFIESHSETNRALVKTIEVASFKPRVFVTQSLVHAYQVPAGSMCDETAPLKDGADGDKSDLFAHAVHEWEHSAQLPKQIAAHVRHVILRTGWIAGKTFTATNESFERVYWPVAMSLFTKRTDAPYSVPFIHVNDFADVLVHVIQNRTINGPVNASSPRHCTPVQVLAAFDPNPTRVMFPVFILNLMMHKERQRAFLVPYKVVPKKLLDTKFAFKMADISVALQQFGKHLVVNEEVYYQKVVSWRLFVFLLPLFYYVVNKF